jgi:hypothetical protein
MPEEISRLLHNGSEIIVRTWTDKVMSDRRVYSDARLSYLQLVDHIPQILEEIRDALVREPESNARPVQGPNHGRMRWKQGYELKEVMRELMLLRTTLLEFIETYRGALHNKQPSQIMQAYRRINGFIDEELYRTIEAYLESGQGAPAAEVMA